MTLALLVVQGEEEDMACLVEEEVEGQLVLVEEEAPGRKVVVGDQLWREKVQALHLLQFPLVQYWKAYQKTEWEQQGLV